jgi:hypothetical protein
LIEDRSSILGQGEINENLILKILNYNHQCCHIKKYLPFLFLPLPFKGRKRFWDMATLVMGNRGEENGKLIIRVFIFDFITINET